MCCPTETGRALVSPNNRIFLFLFFKFLDNDEEGGIAPTVMIKTIPRYFLFVLALEIV